MAAAGDAPVSAAADPGQRILLPHAGSCVRIAQVTDMHLEEARGGRLLGMDTDDSFHHVLGLIRNAAVAPDLVLVTGDVANHGSAAAYQRAREYLNRLGVPWFWLPGNHDDRERMVEGLGDGRPMWRSICVGGWQIVLLDSTVPGQVGGEIGAAEFALLDHWLDSAPRLPTLLCLHHQPVPVGCAWLDTQLVADAAGLLERVAAHAQVRGVVWGHVHQEFAARIGTAEWYGTPSCCIQFAPGSAGFALDEQAPGMRWIELHPDGRIATRVERVSGVAFSFDRSSAGYL